jgi:septum formation protein
MTHAACLVLASGSPRRRQLLERAGLRFEVRPAQLPEERRHGEAPADFARRLAGEKARAVAADLGRERECFVLGADTIVVLEDEVLGKPVDAADALGLLSRLVGRRHRVLTAVAVVQAASGREHAVVVESWVEMREASREELRRYVEGGEPLDKAGAYAVQGEGRRFVRRVAGSESNVIGLPLEETLELLERAGWRRGA